MSKTFSWCLHLSVRVALLGLFATAVPSTAEAQILKKLKDTAADAAESETMDQVDRLVREGVQCAFTDLECIESAEEDGKEVVLTDEEGEVITDDDGTPVQNQEEAAEVVAERAPAPGQGVWANYDFVPGNRVLFYDDFSQDRVGDFPRRLEFVEGNMEIVEWQGDPYLRASQYSKVRVPLPETLPERFTIEFDYHQPAGHQRSAVVTSITEGPLNRYEGSYIQLGNESGVVGGGPKSTTNTYRTREEMTPVRIQVDGSYVKVYLDEERVANLPNAEVSRGDAIQIELYGAQKYPAYLGNLRVAAGGRDLYDRLEAEGRVATRGIYFAVNSDRIRPESTATLRDIAYMLEEHPDLRILIEGHTDADGEDDYNLELSDRRAEAVATYLIESEGIDASRLETAGLGETQPVAANDTPEGKQQNRRVELVRLD